MAVAAYFCAFFSVVLLVLAIARAGPLIVGRYPEIYAEYARERRTAWLGRAWKLAVAVAARELPEWLLSRLRNRIAKDLRRAGDPSWREPELLLGQFLLEGVGVTLGFIVLLNAATGRLYFVVPIGLGLFLALGLRPQSLHSRAQSRINRIGRTLPYSIDLAVLVLTSGGTLRGALEVVHDADPDDPFHRELGMVLEQVRGGARLEAALREMADGLDIEELTSLTIAIERADKMGSPMAEILKSQADIFRSRRLQKAERLAVEAPVKMMFPNMLVMISVILLVLGPIIVQLVQGDWF